MNSFFPPGTNHAMRDRLAFAIEIDKLKTVLRRTILIDKSRRENAAEHSWHVCLMAMVFSDCAPVGTDLCKVLRILLIHDLVEIYAGDTYAYAADAAAAADREEVAAEQLFALLPSTQGEAFRNLWCEFQAQETVEARFCKAIDRLQPLLHNYRTDGQTWKEHGIVPDKVRALMADVGRGSPALGSLASEIINDAELRGFFDPETTGVSSR